MRSIVLKDEIEIMQNHYLAFLYYKTDFKALQHFYKNFLKNSTTVDFGSAVNLFDDVY